MLDRLTPHERELVTAEAEKWAMPWSEVQMIADDIAAYLRTHDNVPDLQEAAFPLLLGEIRDSGREAREQGS